MMDDFEANLFGGEEDIFKALQNLEKTKQTLPSKASENNQKLESIYKGEGEEEEEDRQNHLFQALISNNDAVKKYKQNPLHPLHPLGAAKNEDGEGEGGQEDDLKVGEDVFQNLLADIGIDMSAFGDDLNFVQCMEKPDLLNLTKSVIVDFQEEFDQELVDEKMEHIPIPNELKLGKGSMLP